MATVVVLYRINAQSEVLAGELRAAKVPFVLRDAEHQDPSDDAVTLSTIHSAKGLEWEAVAMIGLSDGLLPPVLADTAAAIAEEKRLSAGLTRARTELRLSCPDRGTWPRNARAVPLPRALLSSGWSERGGYLRTCRSRAHAASRERCWCVMSGGEASEDAVEIKLGRHEGCLARLDVELHALHQWRSVQAHNQSVPAFVVFTDATLRALVEQVAGRPGRFDEDPRHRTGQNGECYGNQPIEVIAHHASV